MLQDSSQDLMKTFKPVQSQALFGNPLEEEKDTDNLMKILDDPQNHKRSRQRKRDIG